MKNADSIKALLKNYSKKNGRTVQDVFTVYVLERILYRISISKFNKNFTLKGGVLLYGLYTDDFTRATIDIDLLGWKISNDSETLKSVFREILSLPADDPIRFDLKALKAVNITEFQKYHGVRIMTLAFLDRTRLPASIDIGFGDLIYPQKIQMDYPTILDDEVPRLYSYSVYSMIAEKAEAIVSLGEVNSRYKDFYDIWIIAKREKLDGEILQKALVETFKNRNTGFEIIVAFEEKFADDNTRQQRWKGFLKNKNVVTGVSFQEVLKHVKTFLLPVIEAIRGNKLFEGTWSPEAERWN